MNAFLPDSGGRDVLDPGKRVSYTLGLVLGEDEFRQEQRYLMERDQRHTRALHGYGTVSGLKVGVREDATVEVVVSAGLATDPGGRDVCVPVAQCADLPAWLRRHGEEIDARLERPDDAVVRTLTLYVVLAFRECPTDEVPVPSGPCRSAEESMAPSRITDDFELRLDFDPPEEVDERAGTALRDLVEALGPALRPVDGEDPVASPPSGPPAASPPGTASPPSPPASPPGGSPPGDEDERIRELVREWVTTGRAGLLGDAACVDVCGDVLLARLDVDVSRDAGGFVVAGPVDVDERDRPFQLTTRLLQEWLINRSSRELRPLALDDLVDVDAAGAVAGDVLTQRGGRWVPHQLPAGGGGGDEEALRRHKRHLHGWGIVCGLQVRCGPEDTRRPAVTVGQGYAIDCDGSDIVVDDDEPVDVMELVRALEESEPDVPVLDDGDGEVCLTLEAGRGDAGHRIGAERYDPSRDTIPGVLAGTMLMDVYANCVRPIEDFLREELRDDDDSSAGPASERGAVLANLLAHVVNPQAGQGMYLSAREHEILRGFSDRLRGLLRSETFCAMFAGARPFPDYPPDLPEGMDTIFGRGHHSRLRLRSTGRAAGEAYTVGGGLDPLRPTALINRYDLARRVLVGRLDPFEGAAERTRGAEVVHDVAFSPDGRRISMVASERDATSTSFRAGDLTEDGVDWGRLLSLPDVNLVTLATTAADPAGVYAIGIGQGLYRIDAETLTSEQVAEFSAAGHLRITDTGQAVVTVASETQPPRYDRLHIYDLRSGELSSEMSLRAAGVDDIAVAEPAGPFASPTVYCVVGLDGSGEKRIEVFDLAQRRLDVSIPVDDTAVRLDVYQPPGSRGALLVTSEDGYVLRLVDLATNEPVSDYELALQAGPIAIAADGAGESAYVLNSLTNTITVVPAEVLDPGFRFPFEALAAYRSGVLEAFADLVGGFLQYLKDCLCHHLLVDCPECTGEERLYLACVSIRDGEVSKVCNFSGRRYVKSFPTVAYWLSLVPILPLAHRLLEWFCCLVLPDVFGRLTAPVRDVPAAEPGRAHGANLRVASIRQGIGAVQAADVPGRIRRGREGLGPALGAAVGSLLDGLAVDPARRPLNLADLLGQPAGMAETMADERGVGVHHAGYDPTSGLDWLDLVTALLRPPRPGEAVTLHERDDRVRSVSVAPAPQVTDERLQSRVAELEAELAQLRAFREEVTAYMRRGGGP